MPKPTPTLSITAQWDGRHDLLLRYVPPPGRTSLPFLITGPSGAQGWRSFMASAGDDCTELLPSSLRLRAGCRSALLRVKPQLLARYATYEPAQPLLDGQGVLLHTSHYAVLLPGTAIEWHWQPPVNGLVLHRGALQRGSGHWTTPAGEVDRLRLNPGTGVAADSGLADYVFLGTANAQKLGKVWQVMDQALPALQRESVTRMLAEALVDFETAYGRAPAQAAMVAMASEKPGFHGDTSDGAMMRLRLPRQGELEPSSLALFIAHEAGHWWNKGLYGADERQPWLTEGHAEWMALWQTLGRGRLTSDQWLQRVQGRLNRCLLDWGSRPWASQAAGRRGNADYDCGVALMLLAQARHGGGLKALASLHGVDGYLNAARLQAWAGPDLGRLIAAPDQALDHGLVHGLRRLGWANAKQVERSEDLAPDSRPEMGGRLLQALMVSDCDGAVGFWTMENGYKLDDQVSCKQLKLGSELRAVQGLPLAEQPLEAWALAHQRCAAGQVLQLQYADGEPGQVTCPSSLPMPPRPWRLVLSAEALKSWMTGPLAKPRP